MANQKRISLAERQRLAAEELESRVIDAPTAADKLSQATEAAEKPRQPRPKRKTTAQIAREQGKVPLGLYFSTEEDLDQARRAFVTDFWEHDGPDTFAEWISQAILAHAARSHTERAELAQHRRRRENGVRGKLRKLDVRREVSEAIEAGLAEDRTQMRRQITISNWCNDAVMAAVNETKNRTAGDLMQIDGPLPPRLRK